MMLNLAVGDTVKQTFIRGCFGYKCEVLTELKKLKQELAPETPGFRTLFPDETRRGVEIVVEDLHKSYVNSCIYSAKKVCLDWFSGNPVLARKNCI